MVRVVLPLVSSVLAVHLDLGVHDAHTCAALGCGNHDSVCWCESSCYGYNDCCSDFEEICPVAPPTLAMRDLNLVVTTDLHSWIEGREHQPHFNATLGHAVSLVERLKELGRASRRDVFFFDNGDINDGTGLSATGQDHVMYLAPLMKTAPYDALNLGNHELYQLDAHGAIPGKACAVAGLRDAGYIAAWQGRYLTSNTVWADSGDPVGSRFTVIHGEFGTQLLVFGFLYNMRDHCDAVVVEDVATAVSAQWFSDALTEHAASSDAIVVLFHIDYRDALQQTVLSAIRRIVGTTKPVQFLTGHSHTRGFERLDDFASSFEAGCKLNTVGFVSFDRAAPQRLWFDYAQIDGNTVQLAGAVNATDAALVTPTGQSVIDAIGKTRAVFGFDAALGCATQRYRLSAGLSEDDSLWRLYANDVLPQALFDSKPVRPQWALVGTGALTYDIYEGPFTVDDAYKASPYGNFWFTMRQVRGQDLSAMLVNLNGGGNVGSGQPRASAFRGFDSGRSIPNYVATGPLVDSTLYDVIYCDFDMYDVEAQLENITGETRQREIFHVGSNTSSVLVDWFRTQPCEVDSMVL